MRTNFQITILDDFDYSYEENTPQYIDSGGEFQGLNKKPSWVRDNKGFNNKNPRFRWKNTCFKWKTPWLR